MSKKKIRLTHVAQFYEKVLFRVFSLSVRILQFQVVLDRADWLVFEQPLNQQADFELSSFHQQAAVVICQPLLVAGQDHVVADCWHEMNFANQL